MKTITYYRVEYGIKSKSYINIIDMAIWVDEHTDSKGNIYKKSDAEHTAKALQEVFKIVRIVEINEKILEMSD